jgi:hypothetical protein
MADKSCPQCEGAGEVCECIDDFDHENIPVNYEAHDFAGFCVCGCSKMSYAGMPCPTCEPEKLAAYWAEAERRALEWEKTANG